MSDHRLAAVMVTDMVGFTALIGADQDHALQLLARGHELLKSIVAGHGGEWRDDAGDRSLSVFPNAIDAVRCALEIQSRLKDETELNFRIGVDVGDIVDHGRYVYGEPVNTASLIERLADPDGLVITQAVFEAVDGHLELSVIDLGEKVLKNVAHSVRLFALTGRKSRSRLWTLGAALMARRVPHIVGAYLATAWAIVEVTQWLSDQGVFSGTWVYAVIAGLLALIPSVLLMAYVHGAHGRDRFTTFEQIGVPINLLLAVAIAAFAHQSVELTAAPGSVERASVAVLPFMNLDDDHSNDYFGRGLSEELINALARAPGLYVASRTSSFIFDSHDRDPREIARDLRVATILEGSVRRDANRMRITAQLIDGETNFHLWSETYDRELEDVLSVQADIAAEVARRLVGVLQPDVESMLAMSRAATLEAYDFYLRGLSYLRQPPTVDSLRNARELLDRALREDAGYAKAYAALCEVGLEQYVLDRSPSSIDVAEAECLRALRLDSRSREVRYALGVLYRHTGNYERSELLFRELLDEQTTPQALSGLASTLDAQGDATVAERYFETAINLEPGNWHTRLALGEFYYWRCRYEDSLRVLQQVIDLSPDNVRAHLIMGAAHGLNGNSNASLRETLRAIDISPSRGAYRDLGLAYHVVGEYDKAVDAFRKAIELGPDDHATWGSLGDTYTQMAGRAADALAAYTRAAELAEGLLARNPRDWATMARLGVYDVMIGAIEEGVERITTAVANGPDLSDIHLLDAVIQTRLDRHEQALDALERAVELGCYPAWMIAGDPRFSALKDDDRFKRLTAE